MFRRWLSGFLVVQHFYVYTLHGTLTDLKRDTIEITPGDNGRYLRVKLAYTDRHDQEHLIWNHDVEMQGAQFKEGGLSKRPLGQDYRLSYTERHQYITIEKSLGTQSYLFHISPKGDVTLGRLDHTKEVNLQLPGRFSTGEQGLYKAESLSVAASEAYIQGKISADTLKFRMAPKLGRSSPLINAPSGMLMIGHRLDVEQTQTAADHPEYVANLFTNEGKILNKIGRTSYTIDLHGNDLILPLVGRQGPGQSLNEIISKGGLTLTRVRHLYNTARIESGSTLVMAAQGQLHNDKGGLIMAPHTKVTAGGMHNDAQIKGYESFEMHLGSSPSQNTGVIFAGKQGLITVEGAFTNRHQIMASGNLRIQGTRPAARFYNAGSVQASGAFEILSFGEFLQEGRVHNKDQQGHLHIGVRHFIQGASPQVTGPLSGASPIRRIVSDGTLKLSGERFVNHGGIKAFGNAVLDVKNFHNFEDAFLSFFSSASFSGEQFINKGRITARGQLTSTVRTVQNRGLYQAQAIVFEGASLLQNWGQIFAKTLLRLAVRVLENTGVLKSKQDLGWEGETLTNTERLHAYNVHVKGGVVRNAGQWEVANQFRAALKQLSNTQDMSLVGFVSDHIQELVNDGHMRIGGSLKGRIESLFNRSHIEVDEEVALSGQHFTNTQSFHVGGDADLHFSQAFTNSALTEVEGHLTLHAKRFDHAPAAQLKVGHNSRLELEEFQNQGLMGSNGDIEIAIQPTQNQLSRNAGTILAGHALRMRSDATLINAPEGFIEAQDAITIRGQGHFVNKGQFTPRATVFVDINHFENASRLVVPRGAQWKSRQVSNTGKIEVSQTLEIDNFETLINTGALHSDSLTTLQGKTLLNRGTGAELTARDHLRVDVKSLHNEGMVEGGTLSEITAQTLYNRHLMGTLLGSLKIKAHDFTNTHLITSPSGPLSLALTRGTQSGAIFSKGDMTLQVDDLLTLDKRQPEGKPEIEAQEGVIRFLGAGRIRNEGGVLTNQDLLINLDFENGGSLQGAMMRIEGTLERLLRFSNLENANIISLNTLEGEGLETVDNKGNITSETAFSIQARNFNNEGQIVSRQGTGQIRAHHYQNKRLTSHQTGIIGAREGLSIEATASLSDQGTLQSPKTIEIKGQGTPGTISGTISGEDGVEITSLGTNRWDVALTNTATLVSQKTLLSQGLNTLTVAGKVLAETLNLHDITTLITHMGSLLQGTTSTALTEMTTLTHQGDLKTRSLTGHGLGTVSISESGSVAARDSIALKGFHSLQVLGKLLSGGGISLEDVRTLTVGKAATLHSKGHLSLHNTEALSIAGQVVSDSFVGHLINGIVVLKDALFSAEKSSQFTETQSFTNQGQYQSGTNFEIKTRQLTNEGDLFSRQGHGHLTTEDYTNTGTIAAHEGLRLNTSKSYTESGTFHSPKTIDIKGQGAPGTISGTISGEDGVEITSLGTNRWDVALTNTATLASQKTLLLQGLNTLIVAGKVLAEALKLHDITTLITHMGSLLQGTTSTALTEMTTLTHQGDLKTRSLTSQGLGTVSISESGSVAARDSMALKGLHSLQVLGKLLSGGGISLEDVRTLTVGSLGLVSGATSLGIKKTDALTVGGKILSGSFFSDAVKAVRILVSGHLHSRTQATLKGMETLEVSGKLQSGSDLAVTGLTGALRNTGSISAQRKVTLQGTGPLINSKELISGGDIFLSEWRGKIENQVGGKIDAASALTIANAPHIQNLGLMHGGQGISLITELLENGTTGIITAVDSQGARPAHLSITTTQGHNKGQIDSSGTSILKIQRGFQNEKTFFTEGKLTVIGQGEHSVLTNAGANAHLHSQHEIEFKGDGPRSKLIVNNNAGSSKIEASRDVTWGVGSVLENGGQVLSKGKVTLHQDTFENKGVLSALSLGFSNLVTLVNTASGQLLSLSDITWSRLQSLTQSGVIQLKKNLTLSNLKTLILSGQLISQEGVIAITQSTPWTQSGQLQGHQGIAITGPEFTNRGVLSSPQGSVGINSAKLTNLGRMSGQKVILNGGQGTVQNAGSIKATHEVKLSSHTLTFSNGQTIEAPEISLSASGQTMIIPAGLNPLNRLTLIGPKGVTLGSTTAGYRLDITGPLTLQGRMTFSKGLTLDIPGHFTNAFGIWGEGPLMLKVGGTFTNAADCYSSTQALTLTSGALANNALLYGHLPSTISVTGAITNTKTLASGSHLGITGQSLSNAKGAFVDAMGNLSITVRGDLTNTVGTLASGGTMTLKGTRLLNQRDGYRTLPKFQRNGRTVTQEVANSPNEDAKIIAQGSMSLTFNSLFNEASQIISAQGDVALNFTSLQNLTKFLKTLEEWVHSWKGGRRGFHGGKWHHDPQSSTTYTSLPSLISAGRDVIFEINGQRQPLPATVPQAWENYRQQVLQSKKNKQKFDIWMRTSNHWGDGITWDSARITVDPAYATLSPDLKPFANPNSFLSNDHEKRLIIVKYLSKPIMKWSSRNKANRQLVPSGIPQRTLHTETITVANPRKVLLEALFPGLTNTGTIVGRTVRGNVGHFQHGFKNSSAPSPQEKLSNVVIQAVNYLMGVGSGHLWRVQSQGNTLIANVIAPNEETLEATANTPYLDGRHYRNLLESLGRPVQGTQMGENTLVLSTPFHGVGTQTRMTTNSDLPFAEDALGLTPLPGEIIRNGASPGELSDVTAVDWLLTALQSVGMGNLLYTGQISYLTGRDLTSEPSRIAVVDHPALTGHERMMMPPHIEAVILQRAFLNELNTPHIYANVLNRHQQHWVLRENGLRQARKLKGLSPLPEDASQAVGPHRELISPALLSKFKDPAIVYQLTHYANEWVLAASFLMGEDLARKFFRAHEGHILGQVVDLSSMSFDVSGDMTTGRLSVSADQPSRIEGAILDAQEDLKLRAPQLEIKSKATVTHTGSGKNYTHTQVQKRSQIHSKGRAEIHAPQSLSLTSSTLKGKKGLHIKTGHITQQDDEDVSISHTESSKRKGLSKKTTVTHNETHTTVRTQMDGGDTGVVIETQQGGYLEAPIIDGSQGLTLLKEAPHSQFVIGTSQDSRLRSQTKTKKTFATQSLKDQGQHTTQVHTLESRGGVRGDLENARVQVPQKGGSLAQTLDALEKDPKTAWVKDLRKNPHIHWEQVSEIHDSWNHKSFGLTPGASLVLSLAVAIAVAGPASSLATSLGFTGATTTSVVAHGMATTAFKTIASQAALSLVNAKGNVGTALKQLVSTQNIKHLAATVAASGIIGSSPTMPANASLLDHAKTALIHTTTQKATQVAIEGKSLKRALKEAPLEMGVDALSGYGAQKIGDLKEGMLQTAPQKNANPTTSMANRIPTELTHKVAHALLGATTGAIFSKDKKKGAISGALGAVVAETVAEQLPMQSTPGQGLDSHLTRPALPQHGEVAKLVATTVSTLSGLDAELSLTTADNAVRYNYENHQHMTEEEQERARQMLADNEEIPVMKSVANLLHEGLDAAYEMSSNIPFLKDNKTYQGLNNLKNKALHTVVDTLTPTKAQEVAIAANLSVINGTMVREGVEIAKPLIKSITNKLTQKAETQAIKSLSSNTGTKALILERKAPNAFERSFSSATETKQPTQTSATTPGTLQTQTASKSHAHATGQSSSNKTLTQAEPPIKDGKQELPFPGEKTSKPKNVVDSNSFSETSKITALERKGRVMFDNVEFRAVRDLSHMSEQDLRRMYAKGVNPYDVTKNRLDGHHFAQEYHRKEGAFIVEIPEPNHNISNPIQHPKGNAKGVGLTNEQREDWKKVRIEFNKERAKQELINRGLLKSE